MEGNQRPAGNPARLRLRVTAAAESRVREGHPWVYAQSVREQNRDGTCGELAVIYDRKNRFLAAGLYDPDSPIRVRVLQAGRPQPVDRQWLAGRLATSVTRRQGLFDSGTTGFRWINGESDGWPGLVLDKYDRTLVLKLYTPAWVPHLETLKSLLAEQLQPERVVLRLSRNAQAMATAPLGETGAQVILGPPVSEPVQFLENQIRFEADVLRGQKTGFFLDQRENRLCVEALARGRTVLNTFSFSGAFSVYAARGSASAVTDLDISAHALSSAARNFGLNAHFPGVASCPRESIQADAFEWLASDRRQFGLVILDPPSLAKREAERSGAIAAYARLVRLAVHQLAPRGILVACSCSAHVSAEEFFETVRRSARESGSLRELKTTLHPADHPAAIPEAHYLKAIYLQR